ncbi:MAG: deoxyguanosinetriphosphate triphosphohydrolase [Planctomycetota bacterium]
MSFSRNPQDREESLLAPYAMASRNSRGRVHGEEDDDLRTPFERDRDRIIHSTAFRRLEYKTQVFVNHEGDHYRTRLTHTLEVAQISRSGARALGLNEQLVEAIALSHDLGHPPFGHAGEEKLDELMADAGGFNHNLHCLRVVDLLEQRYPDFPGLNLSWEIRESIIKHGSSADSPLTAEFQPQWRPLLEAQLVDIGDSLAYVSHDLDDALRSGYLSVADFRDVELWKRAEKEVRSRWHDIDERYLVARVVSRIIDSQVRDLVAESMRRLKHNCIDSVDAVRTHGQDLIAFSETMQRDKRELKEFLNQHLYHHSRSVRMAEKGKRFLEAVFLEYLRVPDQLPREYRRRIAEQEPKRVICDYLAGMTDRFCLQEYMRLFVPFADARGFHVE